MKKDEAYSILGLTTSASDEEVKKAFKKKSVTMHPDKGGDPEEYKKVTEAFHAIKTSSFEDQNVGWTDPFWQPDPFYHMRNPWGRNSRPQVVVSHPVPDPIYTELNLTFNDSVLGCTKKIQLNRRNKCNDCNGLGVIISEDNCSKCNGLGMITVPQRGFSSSHTVLIQMQCPECNGLGKESSDCNSCSGKGGILQDTELEVKIRGGLVNGNVIRLKNAGHHFYLRGMPANGEVRIKINVEKNNDMRVLGNNVVSNINLSLLEALKGGVKVVDTVDGKRSLEIPSNTREKDQLKIEKLGVERLGDHIFNVSVTYPEETDKLIEFLEKL